MNLKIDGIVPVMLTPFDSSGQIDFEGLGNLTEWYIENGAQALFAVCQSSEMQFLSVKERVEIARLVVNQVNGRIPVIASGHVADDIDDQHAELAAISDTGIDAIVFVSNRLDANASGFNALTGTLQKLIGKLPSDLPLGLYECPAPYRRLLSDDEIKFCRDTGRFAVLKDVSCDLATIKRRLALVSDTGLRIVNANAAIAFEAMKAGSAGFAGVFTNFHPNLYGWLYANKASEDPLVSDLTTFLALSACAESMGYPGLAKMYHQQIGTFRSSFSRAIDYDVAERHWAAMDIINHIHAATMRFRDQIDQQTVNRHAKLTPLLGKSVSKSDPL